MSGIMLAASYCGLWAGTAAHPSEAHPVSLVMPGPPCLSLLIVEKRSKSPHACLGQSSCAPVLCSRRGRGRRMGAARHLVWVPGAA